MNRPGRDRRASAGRARACRRLSSAVALVGVVLLVSCSESLPTGLPPDVVMSLTFTALPVQTQAGRVIQPPVEVTLRDRGGNPLDGTVTLALTPNYCGAKLSGTTSVATANGVATFGNLSIDLLGAGYVLKATSGSVAANSGAFSVASTVTGETLSHETTVCTTPKVQSDASGLAWVPPDNTLWYADDNLGSVNGVDRRTGALRRRISQDEFIAAFPDAVCDDGDGNPATSCSYFEEFEVVAYDRQDGSLYVINTVNNPALVPPVDRPAIFRLVRQGCASCFEFAGWRALPEGFAYNAAVVIGGKLYVADVRRLYHYDFETNELDTTVPILTASARIRGLSYEQPHLWVLTRTGTASGSVSRISVSNWATGQELATHELAPFGVPDLAGIEVVKGVVYAVDGTPLNPIHVFTVSGG